MKTDHQIIFPEICLFRTMCYTLFVKVLHTDIHIHCTTYINRLNKKPACKQVKNGQASPSCINYRKYLRKIHIPSCILYN